MVVPKTSEQYHRRRHKECRVQPRTKTTRTQPAVVTTRRHNLHRRRSVRNASGGELRGRNASEADSEVDGSDKGNEEGIRDHPGHAAKQQQ